MQLRQDPEAIAPEQAIVFEVAGALPNFYAEAARIGLEYLADDQIEIEPDDDFRLAKKPDDPIFRPPLLGHAGPGGAESTR